MKLFGLKLRLVAPVVVVCCFVCLGGQSLQAQQTFSFPNFNSAAGLQLNGNAAVVTVGEAPAVLRITPNQGGQVGSTFFNTLLPLKAGFTTTFTFQFTGRGGSGGGADGIAFVIHGAPGGAMTLGSTGGAIGYGDDDVDDDPLHGIPNSVAVEFDTFTNGWDPNNNHVAIQSCGTGNNSQHHNALCHNGSRSGVSPELAIFSGLSDLNINLADGNPHTAIVAYTPPCDGCQNLTVTLDGHQVMATSMDLASLGLDANDDAFVGFTGSTGGGVENQDILSWTLSSQTITQPVSTTVPTTFAFSNTAGTILSHTVDFTPPAGQLTYPLNDPTTIQIQSTNTSVDVNTWPQYVTGGPLAPSTLFPLADDNPGGVGSNGGLFVDLCFDPTLTGNPSALIPSDTNCPFVPNSSDNLLGINIVADLVTKPGITPGTTSVMAHYEPNTTGTTTWSPSAINGTPNPVCTATTGLSSGTQPAAPTSCDVLDIQQSLSGDQTTSSGRSRGKGTFAFAHDVPMLLSTVSVNGTPVNQPPANNPAFSAGLWFSAQHGLNLSFLVNPACIPGFCPAVAPALGNNFFNPAPVAGENFDVRKLSDNSPVVPTTAATPPDGFNTAHAVPFTFGAQPSLADGQYLLEWSAFDNVGILEQNQQLVPTAPTANCPDGSLASTGACYTTSLFGAQLNVDSTNPNLICGAPDGVWHNADVSIGCSASDATSGLHSPSPAGPGVNENFPLTTSVPTGTETNNAPTNSLAVCDLAANCVTAGPVSGNMVDKKPPTISIASPVSGVYTANQKVPSSYNCVDGGSGLAPLPSGCNGVGNSGPVASGSNIDTKPTNGLSTPKTFTVNSVDNVGNAAPASIVAYTVSCNYAAVGISPSTVTRPALINITTSVIDCMSAPQIVSVQFKLSGPLGKNCSHSSTVMFTTPPFTIKSGTSNSFTFPFLIAKNACAGTYTVTTTTLQGGSPIDVVTSALKVN
jgi:hypothetical protein